MSVEEIVVLAGGISQAAIQRSVLKHSWLENEVLNKTSKVVVFLRHTEGWPSLPRFLDESQRALALADCVENGFSPASLVDECAPLVRLPRDLRECIRSAIHASYLDYFDASGKAQDLRNASIQMHAALVALLREWSNDIELINDSELEVGWQKVLDKAEMLRDALDALPRGIVLP